MDDTWPPQQEFNSVFAIILLLSFSLSKASQYISKGAEYAARLTFNKRYHIAIHWQDADLSSSNAMTEHFPDAEIMICGGHAGEAHKKQLEELAKKIFH